LEDEDIAGGSSEKIEHNVRTRNGYCTIRTVLFSVNIHKCLLFFVKKSNGISLDKLRRTSSVA